MPISLIKEEAEHILRVLPVLLRRDEQFRREVAIVLSEVFATKNEIKQILEEIRLSREETNRRFEEMNREMNRRFEEMNREMNRRFEEQGQAIVSLTKTVEKMGMSIRTIGSRWGKEAEVTIRKTLQELLLKNLKVADVSEWKIKDTEGKVRMPGAEIQVDLLIRNGEHFLAEIKSSADEDHVDRFYKIGQLYQEKTGITPKLLFVAVTMREEGELLCQKLGIQLITYDELES